MSLDTESLSVGFVSSNDNVCNFDLVVWTSFSTNPVSCDSTENNINIM